MENFSEIYTRYSKALVGVGSSIGSDQANNLELELIAKENPYTDDMSDGIEILYCIMDNLMHLRPPTSLSVRPLISVSILSPFKLMKKEWQR